MRFINHNWHVKRRGDFGTFCLVLFALRRAKPKLKGRRCLTCFCLSLVCAACCYSNFEKWVKNCGLQTTIRYLFRTNFELWGALGCVRQRQNFFTYLGLVYGVLFQLFLVPPEIIKKRKFFWISISIPTPWKKIQAWGFPLPYESDNNDQYKWPKKFVC